MPLESTAPLIGVSQATFGYRGRAVVRVDELRLRPGRCLGIFGPNGSGKTTLVRGLTGLLPPLAGSVVRGRAPAGAGRGALRFGYLPQHRAMEAHWPMTGADAASLAVSARRPFGWMFRGAGAVRRSMEALGVGPLARAPFAGLSGGQQQRLLLAGALAAGPHLLFLDEPTDGLDLRSRNVLLDVLRQTTGRGLCAVVISHDVEDLLALCGEVAWLRPADDAGRPSTVELIPSEAFVARIAAAREAV